jgi:hypothetical protein
MQVTQHCTWAFLIFKGTFKMVVSIDLQPAARSLNFGLVNSTFMKHLQGRWEVEDMGGGSCRVVYVLESVPALSPPAALSFYTSKIFVRQAETVLGDLEAELERRSMRRVDLP